MNRLTEKITNRNTGETLAYRLNTGVGRLKALQKLGQYEDKEERGFADWIPACVPPDDDRYILLSFANFSCPQIGRYKKTKEGGNYYLGDEQDTCLANVLIVNAWMELPKCYKEK